MCSHINSIYTALEAINIDNLQSVNEWIQEHGINPNVFSLFKVYASAGESLLPLDVQLAKVAMNRLINEMKEQNPNYIFKNLWSLQLLLDKLQTPTDSPKFQYEQALLLLLAKGLEASLDKKMVENLKEAIAYREGAR